jgi:N-acetylglutamate synthase-like GNAT family acetyltransferase
MTTLSAENDEYHFIISQSIKGVDSDNIKDAIHENNIILDEYSFRDTIIESMGKQNMCHTIDTTTIPISTIPHPDIYRIFNTFKYDNMFCVINNGIVRVCSIILITKSYVYITVICNDPHYGRGYGKILINKMCDICRSLNIPSIQLYADEGARPYYINLGFHSISNDPASKYLIMEIPRSTTSSSSLKRAVSNKPVHRTRSASLKRAVSNKPVHRSSSASVTPVKSNRRTVSKHSTSRLKHSHTHYTRSKK